MRVIFTLPESFTEINGKATKEPLIYVEWFKTVGNVTESTSNMYEVRKQRESGNSEIVGEVVMLSKVRQSIQLIPVFGQKVNRDWTSETVLDLCVKVITFTLTILGILLHISLYTDTSIYCYKAILYYSLAI